jgi:hypothetical protein
MHFFISFALVSANYSTAPKGLNPAFDPAPEVFRVFVTAHPEIEIKPINARQAVTAMIRHAVGGKQAH